MNSSCLQIKPDPPKDEWEPTKQSFWIRTGQDLWRVAHKSKFARLTVPSLEFEIQADGQRHIDSIYNHFGNAVTNLAAYASSLVMGVSLLSDRMSDLADDPCRGSKAAAAMPDTLQIHPGFGLFVLLALSDAFRVSRVDFSGSFFCGISQGRGFGSRVWVASQ